MKHLLLTGILIVFAMAVKAQEAPDPGKLQGTWQQITDTNRFEQWWPADSGSLQGRSFKIKASGDTVVWENLSLYQREGHWYYRAIVMKNPAVDFKLTGSSNTLWTFSNPLHDFPQEITYLFQADALKVTISGGGRPQEFVFRKIR